MEKFWVLYCATLPETLFESILFGTEKGGFTGATNKMGLFEQANCTDPKKLDKLI